MLYEGRVAGEVNTEVVLGEAVCGVRPLLLPAEFGVCGLEVDGVSDLKENSRFDKLVVL